MGTQLQKAHSPSLLQALKAQASPPSPSEKSSIYVKPEAQQGQPYLVGPHWSRYREQSRKCLNKGVI